MNVRVDLGVSSEQPSSGSGALVAEPKIDIRVVHASLEYAHYPVMVGHYEGATLRGAEAFVDDRLDGLLSKRQMIGQYPQLTGQAVFIPPRRRRMAAGTDDVPTFPPGTYVLGLGPPGELSHNSLVGSVKAALVERGIDLYESGGEPGGLVEFGVATVLVGAFPVEGLTVEASLVAIVDGLLSANDAFRRFEAAALEARRPTSRVRVTALEVIERFADRAELAAHAVRLLPHLLDRVDDLSELIERTDVVVEARPGGLPYRPPLEEVESSWRRIMITSTDEEPDLPERSNGDEPSTLELDITVLGRLARADRLQHLVDRRTVDNLVATAITESRPDAQVANTLWELLVPVDLKEGVILGGRIQLIVDDRTANYPWEVMTARGSIGSAMPLSLARGGLLRQFREGSGAHRIRTRRSLADRVLVVGSPPIRSGDYPAISGRYEPLPGATREARSVSEVMKASGFAVTSLIWGAAGFEDSGDADIDHDAADNSGRAVINALFKADYRIVHVAAHGIVSEDSAESGAMIGGGMLLTANIIRQLPIVPDIVFLNCCHLAQIGFNRLAAGVSRELLRIGVQVVVAAGWQVDDSAADLFARTFYGALLRGREYGDAVREARNAAHEQSASLTWGAYQCYGDPGFRLTLRGGGSTLERPRPVSQSELIREVTSVRVRAADVGRPDTGELEGRRTRLLTELADLESGADEKWLDAQAATAFGRAYAALGNEDHAVAWYRTAREVGHGHPVELYELLANAEVRLAQDIAANQLRPEGARISDSPDELVRSARQHLAEVASLPLTWERKAIEASLEKKSAAFVPTERRGAGLRDAADAYRTAYEMHRHAVDAHPGAERDSYTVLNWLQLESLTDPWPPTTPLLLEQLGEVRRWLDGSTPAAPIRRHDERVSPDFWYAARAGDLAFTEMLVTPNGDGLTPEAIRHVADSYLRAFAMRSSWGNRSSVLDHLRDLRALVVSAPEVVDAIDQLLRELSTWDAASGDTAPRAP